MRDHDFVFLTSAGRIRREEFDMVESFFQFIHQVLTSRV